MKSELRVVLSLSPEDMGILLASLTSIREMAEDSLEDQAQVKLARRELQFVRRVRWQIDEALGAGHAAELERRVHELYAEALEGMGYPRGENEPDPNMMP